jgi:hypothetical protein
LPAVGKRIKSDSLFLEHTVRNESDCSHHVRSRFAGSPKNWTVPSRPAMNYRTTSKAYRLSTLSLGGNTSGPGEPAFRSILAVGRVILTHDGETVRLVSGTITRHGDISQVLRDTLRFKRATLTVSQDGSLVVRGGFKVVRDTAPGVRVRFSVFRATFMLLPDASSVVLEALSFVLDGFSPVRETLWRLGDILSDIRAI